LEALLGRPLGDGQPTALTPASAAGTGAVVATAAIPADAIVHLPVGEIDANPFQPRREYDSAAIAELVGSLKEHGLLQPIVVRQVNGGYQLIAGDRRLRAAKQAGWKTVPVQVRHADDRQVAELAIVENLQRRDLNALEKAASFQQYLERWKCTQEELAKRLNIDRSTVANLIRLLELPARIQEALRTGKITPGHARALLPLGDEREQLALCKQIEEESLSVRTTEDLVAELIREADVDPHNPIAGTVRKAKPKRSRNEHIAALEQQLRLSLGVKIELKQSTGGKGKLVLHFRNHEEFDRLFSDLTGQSTRRKAG
jgi:ParB family chromosome partitioning protein